MSTATVKLRRFESKRGSRSRRLSSWIRSAQLNSYLNLAVRQLVNQRKIPFEIVGRAEVPNEVTRRAMVIAELMSWGFCRTIACHSITLMSLCHSSMRNSDVRD